MNTDPGSTRFYPDAIPQIVSNGVEPGATSIGGDIVLTAVRPKGRRGTRGQIPTPPLGAVVPLIRARPQGRVYLKPSQLRTRPLPAPYRAGYFER